MTQPAGGNEPDQNAEEVSDADEIEFDDRTTREEFNAALDRFADEHPSLSAPELARAFGAHLPEYNRELVRRMIASSAFALLASRFRSRFSRVRNTVFATLDIPSVTPAKTPPRRLLTVAEKIEKWREWLPNRGQKLLMEMTMAEVNVAWNTRTQRMLAEAWRAEVLRRIYAARDSEDQLVREKFSADDIRLIVSATRSEMYAGNLRIAVRAAAPAPRQPRRRRSPNQESNQ